MTKAHLIRGAFYLLLLLAACAIPFALGQRSQRGQREINKRLNVERPSLKQHTLPQQPTPVQPTACTLSGRLGWAPPGGDTGFVFPRIFEPGNPTVTCGAAATWPGTTGTGPYFYNVHDITNSGATPLCTTVTLHVVGQGTEVVDMQLSAFMAPFAATDISNSARYLGDAGVSTGNPPVDTTFQLTVPASTTIALVAFNTNVAPAGFGTTYQIILDQDIFCGLPCALGWSAGPDLLSVGIRMVGVYFPNGKFYAMGGRSSDSPGTDFTHPFEYDPVANTWTTKAATYPDNQVNNMA